MQILPKCCRTGAVNPKNYGFIGFLVNLIEVKILIAELIL
jgi:hypothetical protein